MTLVFSIIEQLSYIKWCYFASKEKAISVCSMNRHPVSMVYFPQNRKYRLNPIADTRKNPELSSAFCSRMVNVLVISLKEYCCELFVRNTTSYYISIILESRLIYHICVKFSRCLASLIRPQHHHKIKHQQLYFS